MGSVETTKSTTHVFAELVAFANQKSDYNPVDLTSGDYYITGGIQRAHSTNTGTDLTNPKDWDSDANGNG